MPNELINSATEIVEGLSKDIYRDLLHPSVSRVGLSLDAIVKMTLSPIGILDWGFEKSKDWLREKICIRVAEIPEEFRAAPPVATVSTALHHIALSCDAPELQALYAELLLKSLDTRVQQDIHPAYFYIIEQMIPQEALVLFGLHQRNTMELFRETIHFVDGIAQNSETVEQQFVLYCEDVLHCPPKSCSVWLTNLCRLGVLSLTAVSEAVLKSDSFVGQGMLMPEEQDHLENMAHRRLEFTQFGKEFISACAPPSWQGQLDPYRD